LLFQGPLNASAAAAAAAAAGGGGGGGGQGRSWPQSPWSEHPSHYYGRTQDFRLSGRRGFRFIQFIHTSHFIPHQVIEKQNNVYNTHQNTQVC